MINYIKKNIEPNIKIRNVQIISIILLFVIAACVSIYGKRINDSNLFTLSIAITIFTFSIVIVLLYSRLFSLYEKSWLIITMFLAMVISFLFPSEDINGFNGVLIMFLYLADTFLNILCELLISKQSRYNFLVSILVELTEIATCIVLMYRFTTMAVTIFFWIPIDIISFINWSKHKDEENSEITIVRKLNTKQEIIIIIAIVVWVLFTSKLVSGLNIRTDLISSQSIANTIIYLDACASALGIANGIFIFLRLKEQWYAWYLYTIVDAIINILSGQYVFLVLKLAFLVNTTYGYIKWSSYIKKRSFN